MRRAALLVLLLSGGAIALGARQDGQPTFRSGIDIVHVDVSVLDKNRQPVRGLTAEDFQVLENGKPRPIVAFTSVELPRRISPTAPWMGDIAPDVMTNVFPREGRLIVIVMDRSITTDQVQFARSIGRAAVDQLRPGDLAAVVYTGWGLPQNFTTDRQRLLDAIERPYATLPEGDDGESGDCFCGACSLDTMADIAEMMGTVPQRRKVMLSIGSSLSMRSNGICGGPLEAARQRLMRATDVANLTINSFDPSSLQTYMNAQGTARQRQVMANLTRMGNLAELPDHTGGRAVHSGTLEQVTAVMSESASYYVLGVEPTPNVRGLRELDVRVNRRDVSVQSRRGYYPPGSEPRRSVKPAPGISATLATAIAGLWPRTEIPMQVTAIPMAVPGLAGASVAVVVTVERDLELGFVPASGQGASTVDVLTSAYDRNSRPVASHRQTLSITIPPGTTQAAGYTVMSRLTLGPGRYEIRAAVDDQAIGKSASAYTSVDVPNFLKDPVSLSALMLEAIPEGATKPEGMTQQSIPIVPTARRDFFPTDRVRGFVRIYEGVSNAVMPVYLIARLLDDSDHRVFQQEVRVPIEDFRVDRSRDFAVDLPVERLPPGEYLLTINVSHGNDVAQRDVRFRMRP